MQSSQRCDWSWFHSWGIYEGCQRKDFPASKKAGGSCSHFSTSEIPSSLSNSLNLQVSRNLSIFKNYTLLWIILNVVNLSKKRQAGRQSEYFCKLLKVELRQELYPGSLLTKNPNYSMHLKAFKNNNEKCSKKGNSVYCIQQNLFKENSIKTNQFWNWHPLNLIYSTYKLRLFKQRERR